MSIGAGDTRVPQDRIAQRDTIGECQAVGKHNPNARGSEDRETGSHGRLDEMLADLGPTHRGPVDSPRRREHPHFDVVASGWGNGQIPEGRGRTPREERARGHDRGELFRFQSLPQCPGLSRWKVVDPRVFCGVSPPVHADERMLEISASQPAAAHPERLGMLGREDLTELLREWGAWMRHRTSLIGLLRNQTGLARSVEKTRVLPAYGCV